MYDGVTDGVRENVWVANGATVQDADSVEGRVVDGVRGTDGECDGVRVSHGVAEWGTDGVGDCQCACVGEEDDVVVIVGHGKTRTAPGYCQHNTECGFTGRRAREREPLVAHFRALPVLHLRDGTAYRAAVARGGLGIHVQLLAVPLRVLCVGLPCLRSCSPSHAPSTARTPG